MQESIIKIVSNFLSKFEISEPMVGIVIGKFLFLFSELVLLFIVISFIVALLQIYISKDKIQKILTTKSKFLNSILGALLGSVTPFCSCSTIPLLVGLIKSKAPFSGTMSFLLTSPVLNPGIIILFLTFFGIVPTITYASIAFIFAVIVGYCLDVKGFARYIKIEAFGSKNESKSCACQTSNTSSDASCSESKACDSNKEISYSNFTGSFLEKNITASKYALKDSIKLFRKVLIFLIFGAGIGSFIYGFVPEELFRQFAGANNFFSVPLAALLGIPMYIRTETMIPIASVLVSKGVGLGTMVALIIGGAGASIPEVSLLGSIFKKELVITFLICIFTVAVLTGYAFNIFLG